MKKLILGITAMILIYLGGNGTQSSNMFFQGSGFVGLIIGLVVLYLFVKMVWKAMGCLPVILIICLIAGFILYAIGGFNGGISNIVPNVKSFLGLEQGESVSTGFEETIPAPDQVFAEKETAEDPDAPKIGENFGDIKAPRNDNAPSAPKPLNMQEVASAPSEPQRPLRQPEQVDNTEQSKEGGFSRFLNSFAVKKEVPTAPVRFNPNDYPAIRGVTRVINGDTLEMNGRYLRLYGIDAPESNQTCSDNRGRAYRCGQEAARWLKSWISGHELECHVLKQDSKGNMVATCALGQYDIGAALVNAGWAVVDPRQNDIYTPYEMQARENGYGLWQGQFYKPWDWREIQAAKPKIKIIKPKRPKKGLLDL